jgi:hypothetical protein
MSYPQYIEDLEADLKDEEVSAVWEEGDCLMIKFRSGKTLVVTAVIENVVNARVLCGNTVRVNVNL